MQELEGKLTISYPQGNDCDYVAITVTDKKSGIQFLECHVKYAEFALALSSRFVDCNFQLLGVETVGMTREHKEKLVFVPDGNQEERIDRAIQAVADQKVEGFNGQVEDALNHHNIVSREKAGTWYRVSFVRYVEGEHK